MPAPTSDPSPDQHPLDGIDTPPLAVPFTQTEREALVARTHSAIAAHTTATTPQLTADSAAAFDRLVESGWADRESLPVLAALTPADLGSPAGRLLNETIDRITAPLPFKPAATDPEELGRSWTVARIGGIAAAIALAVVIFNPALNQGGEGNQAGGIVSPQVEPAQEHRPETVEDAEGATDEPEIDPAARIRFDW